ncbi:MAG TPA: SRPBCC domain-containing protein [Flavobacteriales bacterium]|nr:SRPBCC domain-containing protein [Flavobacteriales bacterium]HIN40442.1 SRPBCC domain-containing protein [Flavobacteriales bacterium]
MEIMKKFELEYIIRTSPKVLFTRLNTADGLSQWFADDVNINNGIHTFVWEGIGQEAKKIKEKAGKFVRFQWLDQDDDSYFEFKLEIDDITSEVALIITDFAEEDEIEEAKLLWDSQVNSLMQLLGS